MPPNVQTRSAYRSGGSVLLALQKTPPRNKKNGRFTTAQRTAAVARIAQGIRERAQRAQRAQRATRQTPQRATPQTPQRATCGRGRKALKAGAALNRKGTREGRPGVKCP